MADTKRVRFVEEGASMRDELGGKGAILPK